MPHTLQGHISILECIWPQMKRAGWYKSEIECAELVIDTCDIRLHDMPAVLKLLLGKSYLTTQICQVSRDGRTLLHCAALQLGYLFTEFQIPTDTDNQEPGSLLMEVSNRNRCQVELTARIDAQKDLISKLVIGGSKRSALGSVHIYSQRTTPLLSFVLGICYNLGYFFPKSVEKRLFKLVAEALVHWLRLFQNQGVDLETYGNKEYRIQQEVGYIIPIGWKIGASEYRDCYYSVHFARGAKPENWKIWLIELIGDEFREFWRMVEEPERGIPGSWVDDFDEEDTK